MTADGHPDFNGYWITPNNQSGEQFQKSSDGSILFDFNLDQGAAPMCVGDACQDPNQPAYTGAYLPKVKAIAATEFRGTSPVDPSMSCKPGGVPRAGIGNVHILQTPQIIAMVHGDYSDRLIYMDGRPHPKDLEPSYMGHSIGHWEGNTLVVDTIGLNEDTWLGGGGTSATTIYTSIHSDKEHVMERWTRQGDDITYEATVDDPVALTKPWTIPTRKIHVAKSDEYLNTYFCDSGGMAATMRDHYVKPDPEDRDIKYRCSGHRCGSPTTINPNCTSTNKINCR